jgi:outer membrane protein OmpA-like peptidoglycan-associated protein
MNLFDTLNEALNEDVVSKIAKLSDEEPSKTKKALDGIMYTLIAGLVRRTGSAMSVNMLFNQIQKGGRASELINSPMSYLEKKDKLESILKSGEGLVSQIFPAYKSPLINMIGTYAGIKKNSSTMYSAFMAPLLIDAVGKEISDKKLDVDGLVNYLVDHHAPLLEKAPEDLMEKMIPALGLQELISGKFSASQKANIVSNAKIVKVKSVSSLDKEPDTDSESLSSGGSPISLKWLIGLLVAALVIAGGVYYYMNFYQTSQSEDEIQQVVPTDTTATVSVDTMLKSPQDSVKKDTVTTALPIPPVTDEYSSFGTNLSTYLADATKKAGDVVPMSNIKFVAGTANPDPDSDLIISELSDLMQKYTKLQIQLQGHAVDAGAKNATIAMRRAFAIKTALEKKGIDPKRIDAVGSGNTENKVDVKIVTK